MAAAGRRTVVIAVLSLLVPLIAACGGPAPTTGPTTGPASSPTPVPTPAGSVLPGQEVLVSLGIYSGRPDPAWTLTAEEAVALEELLAGLPQLIDTPPTGGLGYHGFLIERPGEMLVAFRGVVAPYGGTGPRVVRPDPTRSVERFLLETARPHVAAAEFAEGMRGIEGP